MFKGSLVALVTPMTTAGDIDYAALERLLDFHLESKTDGLVLLGSTGEGSALTADERKRFLQHAIHYVQGRLPIVVGVGTNSTSMSITAAQEMVKLGADALLMICPYYNRPTQEGIYQHFKAINDAIDCPIILYNHPGRTGSDMLPTTVQRLAALKNIIGIKEAVIDKERFIALQKLASNDFALYSGDDATCLELMEYGASGVISVVANIIPTVMHAVIAKANAGDIQEANEMLEQNIALISATNIEVNPIPIKWALFRMGYISDGIRLPLTLLTETSQEKFNQVLFAAGLIKKDNSYVQTA